MDVEVYSIHRGRRIKRIVSLSGTVKIQPIRYVHTMVVDSRHKIQPIRYVHTMIVDTRAVSFQATNFLQLLVPQTSACPSLMLSSTPLLLAPLICLVVPRALGFTFSGGHARGFFGSDACRRDTRPVRVLKASTGPTSSNGCARLRELLDGPEILTMPCCYDGLTARLVEDAGFPLTL